MRKKHILSKILGKGQRILRCDLVKCYRYKEYYEAANHANQNINVKGIKEQLSALNREHEKYNCNMEVIRNAKKETEEKKYKRWENWYKIKYICKWMMLGFIFADIFIKIIGRFIEISSKLYIASNILGCLAAIELLFFVVAKIGEWICRLVYKHYADKIQMEINVENNAFSEISRRYYQAIDNLYLSSLEPEAREMALMRREQAAHNQEMIRFEKARQMREEEGIREGMRSREAMEKMLALEEERERRYQEQRKKW